jgi:hypothetical protein
MRTITVTIIEITERCVVARGEKDGIWRIPWKVVPDEERANMLPGTVCELAREKPKTLRMKR